MSKLRQIIADGERCLQFNWVAVAIVVAVATNLVETEAQSDQFSASPTSGRAPLTVTFCASAGIAIDFGDGSSSGMSIAQSGECPAGSPMTAKHTYAAAGTFQVHGSPCPVAGANPCGEAARIASTVKITVTPP